MENELISHKEYYKLSLEIYKTIKIEADKRGVDGKTFLDDKFNAYERLLQNSNDAKEYSVMKTDYLTPPLMEDTSQYSNPKNDNSKLLHFLKIPSIESITSPQWHQMKKERAKRSEIRSNRHKSKYNHLVGIPENHSVSDDHSENVSVTTQEESYPINVVIKDQNGHVVDKYAKEMHEQV